MLPTHAELAELTGVSLITVRRALDELERAGKVRRHQGLGTFLARPRIVTEPTRAGSLLGTLAAGGAGRGARGDRKSTRLNSSHSQISYAVFCLKKKKTTCEVTSHDQLASYR